MITDAIGKLSIINYRLSIRTIRIFALPVFVLYALQVLFPMQGGTNALQLYLIRREYNETISESNSLNCAACCGVDYICL
jgi:hypothetical protein